MRPAAGIDFATSFTEDSGPTTIASVDLSVTDTDDANLTSATIQLTGEVQAESLSVVTDGTSITASYVPGTGILSLTGSDTVAHYQQVLRTLKYNNADQDLHRWCAIGHGRR